MKVAFDSYMVPTDQLKDTIGYGAIRLLETTERVILPAGPLIQILVTASDVIHS